MSLSKNITEFYYTIQICNDQPKLQSSPKNEIKFDNAYFHKTMLPGINISAL